MSNNDRMGDRETRPAEDAPSPRLVEQRIRNRVIEYLALASSFDAQRKYERDVPIEHVPYEIINMWEDSFPVDPRRQSDLPHVYSPDEVVAIRDYQSVWDLTADALPDPYPSLADVQAMPEWETLRRAAEMASEVFARRGKFPEDREAP
jgi:hypothetical protein